MPLSTSCRSALDAGQFTAVDLTEYYLGRIDRLDPRLNSFITVTADAALAGARAADELIRAGAAGPLTGIPFAHKDIFCTRGTRTTCGSRMLDNFVAPYDATVTARLADAGAVMLGKANMDEFAMGSSTENSFYGASRNPWDDNRVPGGSSGGSAAAVAAGLAPWATGTDTGGSIRQPAAFCGLSGMKPTYGRVSRYGMVAFASSLDQGGAFARSAADLSLALRAMCGFDPRDSTSSDHPVDWTDANDANVEDASLTIGLPTEYFSEVGDQTAYDAARQTLESQGHRIIDISLPSTAVAIAAYYVIAGAEASTNLSRYDGVRFGHRAQHADTLDELYQRSRSEGFGAEVKRRILTGTYALSIGYFDAYYVKAQKVRRLIQQEFMAAFESVDVVASPTTPGPAFGIGTLTDDAIRMYQQDAFTIPASLAGLPAMSIPCGAADDLPLGLQLIGRHFDEATLLGLAHGYQQATDWHQQHPEGWQ